MTEYFKCTYQYQAAVHGFRHAVSQGWQVHRAEETNAPLSPLAGNIYSCLLLQHSTLL